MGSAQLVWELSRLAVADQPGVCAVLKPYMDESGVHDGSPVLTVAAYMARPRDWQNWTKKWNVAKRPIKIFHSADAQNLHGEFEGWEPEDRDAVVKRLIAVMTEFDFPGIVVGIHMGEFAKAVAARPDLRKIFGTPYTACFQWVVQSILNIQADSTNRERVGFIHECNDYQYEALQSFGWVQKNGNPHNVIVGLQFGDKGSYPPLQAADVLAYEGNKRMRDPSRPERRSWQALNAKGAILAAHYGRDNMPDLINRLELFRAGRFNEIDLGAGWNRGRMVLAGAK